MRYPAEETAEKHSKVLNEATRLFRDRGFSGVNVSTIMKAAGLTHGSFYNHFDSKMDLIGKCILHAADQSLADMQTRESTVDGRREYVENYLSTGHRDDPGTGCLMSSLASDVGREKEVKRPMSRYVQSYIEKLATHFPWSKKADARRQAIRVTASLVGALMLARAVDDEELSLEILKEVAAGLTATAK